MDRGSNRKKKEKKKKDMKIRTNPTTVLLIFFKCLMQDYARQRYTLKYT